jgi:4-amino-4-deoxy-L-arabinose transferase-like glycosyltransferase
MPWISFGAVWRGFRITAFDSGMRFLACWAGGSLLILTLVSGKQIYYLLPIFPACAILLTRLMTSVESVSRKDLAFIAPGTIGMALLPALFNSVPELTRGRLTGILENSYAIPLGLCGALLLIPAWKKASSLVPAVATSSAVFIAIVVWGISGSLWDGFDLKPIARFAAECSRPVAWLGDYQGQLNFVGKIPSIKETINTEVLEQWLQEQPSGAVIVRLSESNPAWQNLKEPLRVVDRTEPTGEQKQMISELLSSNPEFPLARLNPEILFAQRIRRGLTFDLTVVVSYRGAATTP